MLGLASVAARGAAGGAMGCLLGSLWCIMCQVVDLEPSLVKLGKVGAMLAPSWGE